MGIDRDPLLLVFLSEPMKLREPPGEVEGRRGNNVSEEPPAKKWFNDNTLEVRYNSYLVVAEAKLVLDQQEGVSVSKDDSTYRLDDPIKRKYLLDRADAYSHQNRYG